MSTTDSASKHQHGLSATDARFQSQADRMTAIEARVAALEKPVVTPPSTYTFFEDFAGTTLSPQWGHHYTCCGSIQHDPTLAYVKDGALHIPAVLRNGTWYADLIDTRDSFQQTYGLFEASMRVVPGDTKAAWPAFWLYAGTFGTDGDEIDIVEMLGKEDMAAAHQTVHKGTAANQAYAPWAAVTAFGSPLVDHVYAVDWRADHIAFLIDGKETWRETSLLISTPKAILLNHGIGGWGGSPLAGATNGGETIVNWVRASK